MTKHILFPIILTALIITFLGFTTNKYQVNTKPQANNNKNEKQTSKVKINNTEIEVEIADTQEKRVKGLSNRDSLDENKGMLFVFPTGSMATFWMKDMKFDLDIIWIRNNEIIKIDKDAKVEKGIPDNKLKLYKSESPINYVLEVNAGFCENKNIKIGDKVELININF